MPMDMVITDTGFALLRFVFCSAMVYCQVAAQQILLNQWPAITPDIEYAGIGHLLLYIDETFYNFSPT